MLCPRQDRGLAFAVATICWLALPPVATARQAEKYDVVSSSHSRHGSSYTVRWTPASEFAGWQESAAHAAPLHVTERGYGLDLQRRGDKMMARMFLRRDSGGYTVWSRAFELPSDRQRSSRAGRTKAGRSFYQAFEALERDYLGDVVLERRDHPSQVGPQHADDARQRPSRRRLLADAAAGIEDNLPVIRRIDRDAGEAFYQAATAGMLNHRNDRRSVYFDPAVVEQGEATRKGAYQLGALVDDIRRDGALRVHELAPDSPLHFAKDGDERFEVRPGDEILRVGGETVFDVQQRLLASGRLPPSAQRQSAVDPRSPTAAAVLADMMLGARIGTTTLQLRRDGAIRELRVDKLPDDDPASFVSGTAHPDKNAIHLRVRSLRPGAARAVGAEAQRLIAELTGQQRTGQQLAELAPGERPALLFDLRGVAGGSPREVGEVMNLFEGSGLAFALRVPTEGSERVELSPDAAQLEHAPLMVLADSSTRGVSELLVAGLQNANRARVVGERTSGQNIAFTSKRLEDGSEIRFSSHELQERGTDGAPTLLSSWGITPDYEVHPSPGRRADRDQALDEALRLVGDIDRAKISGPTVGEGS